MCGILHNHGYYTHFHTHKTTSTTDAIILPNYTPTHHPEQATCIDRILIHDPHKPATQTHDTENITQAFLDHNGVKAAIRIPLLRSNPATATPTTTNIKHTRTTCFQHLIPQPLLSQWAEDLRGKRNRQSPAHTQTSPNFLPRLRPQPTRSHHSKEQ